MAAMLLCCGTDPRWEPQLEVALKGRVFLNEAYSQQLFSRVFLPVMALSPGSQRDAPKGLVLHNCVKRCLPWALPCCGIWCICSYPLACVSGQDLSGGAMPRECWLTHPVRFSHIRYSYMSLLLFGIAFRFWLGLLAISILRYLQEAGQMFLMWR